jgi:uncharacterized protein with FMN-binding domain
MIPKRAIGAIVTTAFALVLLFSFKTPDVTSVLRATAPSDVAVVGQPPASAGASESPVATSVYRDGTYDGTAVRTRYGDVQVEVTVIGGVITEATALQLPSGDGRSDRISQVSAPILRSEVLTAQSAQIDGVTGATYTSTGYARSLQAALDSARAS